MYIYIWRGVWVHSRSALWNVLHRNLRISMHIPLDYLSKIKTRSKNTHHPPETRTGRSTHAKGSPTTPGKRKFIKLPSVFSA